MIAVWRGPAGLHLLRGLMALSLIATAMNAAVSPHDMAPGKPCEPATPAAAESDPHNTAHGTRAPDITPLSPVNGGSGVSAAGHEGGCDHCPSEQCAVSPACSVAGAQMAAAPGPGQVVLTFARAAAVIAPQVLHSTAPTPPTPPPQLPVA